MPSGGWIQHIERPLVTIKTMSVQCDSFMFNKRLILMFCVYTVLDITNLKINKIPPLLYDIDKNVSNIYTESQ